MKNFGEEWKEKIIHLGDINTILPQNKLENFKIDLVIYFLLVNVKGSGRTSMQGSFEIK
jgi:hypothetical protein